VDDLADELELSELLAQRADRCSSGQLQQLALARALLDVEARARLWAALARRPRVAAIIATHLDEDVRHATSVVDLARAKPAEGAG
jgi:hypothetical protein